MRSVESPDPLMTLLESLEANATHLMPAVWPCSTATHAAAARGSHTRTSLAYVPLATGPWLPLLLLLLMATLVTESSCPTSVLVQRAVWESHTRTVVSRADGAGGTGGHTVRPVRVPAECGHACCRRWVPHLDGFVSRGTEKAVLTRCQPIHHAAVPSQADPCRLVGEEAGLHVPHVHLVRTTLPASNAVCVDALPQCRCTVEAEGGVG